MMFHEILIQERKRRGLSQEDLAARLNVSRQAVSKWETGDSVPDLPKLLALSDALNISLDALCGRDTPAPAVEPDVSTKRGHFPVLGAVCILLGLLLAGAIFLLFSLSAPSAPAPSALSVLEQEFTVSGLTFTGKSGIAVVYQFTPSISGEGLTYQIIFTDSDGKTFPIDAPCIGGVCAGEATLPSGFGSYGVTVSVTNGSVSRNVAVARNLSFHHNGASWNPID